MMWAIILIGILLRIVGLNQSLWLDEAAQVLESARPLTEQLNIAGDFWPPLYHLMLHFWMYFGRSEIWLRLLSVGMSISSLYVLTRLARKLKIKPFIPLLFIAISPLHIWYAIEVRPYMLMSLLGLLTTYFLIQKQFIRYTITGIAFWYSSYFALFGILTHGIYLYIFDKKYLRFWLKSLIIQLLGFSFWLPYFWQQFTIGRGLLSTLPGWSDAVSTPIIKSLPLVFSKFILGRITIDNKILYFSLVVILFLFCIDIWRKSLQKDLRLTWQLTLLLIGPILLAFVVSWFIPVIAPQRLLFVLPIFILLAAYGIENHPWKNILLIIFITLNSYSLWLYFTQPRFQREKWREAVSYVESQNQPNSVVLFIFPQAFAPWQWYSQQTVETLAIAPNFVIQKDDLVRLKEAVPAYERIYYFHYLTDLTDPQRLVNQTLSQAGFMELGIQDFPGVGFISIYEKSLAYN